jgi:hypothetical protein
MEPDDGLYSVTCVPIDGTDPRFGTIPCLNLTKPKDPCMTEKVSIARMEAKPSLSVMKSPSRLGTWTTKVCHDSHPGHEAQAHKVQTCTVSRNRNTV